MHLTGTRRRDAGQTVTQLIRSPTSLTSSCPSPITLSKDGARQRVTSGRVTASDGGVTTRTVSGIDIDTTPPVVRFTGPQPGVTYPFKRIPRVRASDATSGIARIHTTVSHHWHGTLDRITCTVTAVDRAGNTATATLHYGHRR